MTGSEDLRLEFRLEYHILYDFTCQLSTPTQTQNRPSSHYSDHRALAIILPLQTFISVLLTLKFSEENNLECTFLNTALTCSDPFRTQIFVYLNTSVCANKMSSKYSSIAKAVVKNSTGHLQACLHACFRVSVCVGVCVFLWLCVCVTKTCLKV